ncbi:ComEA family DNA-binding protein [Neolewinella sp.]|uniref:ComEA family DNA-binding protein n=1 Tax=Neolewinella sp. TaxID=2993543 RepID=UPI003B52F0FD
MHSPTPPKTSPWAYTRAQRGGLLLLIVFVVGCYALSSYLTKPTKSAFTEQDKELVQLADSLRSLTAGESAVSQSAPTVSFPFHPNEVTGEELQRLGLSEKQATAFLRYRAKRPFRDVEDLRKLYVLRPDQADRLVALARLPNQQSGTPPPPSTTSPSESTPPPLGFPFDPNTLPEDSLQLLGLSARQASALIKYRSYRPRTFRRPEDLRKLGALDSQLVDRLLPLVRLAPLKDPAPAAPARLKPVPIDVNRATVAEWQQLPGIGPYRAAQIVKFRDRLGGFTGVQQVAETYGLPDSSYQQIRPLLHAGPITTPLYINRLDAEALSRHPYLDRRTAAIIVRYRDNHGPFTSAAELENVRALTAERRAKLLPYLNFDR